MVEARVEDQIWQFWRLVRKHGGGFLEVASKGPDGFLVQGLLSWDDFWVRLPILKRRNARREDIYCRLKSGQVTVIDDAMVPEGVILQTSWDRCQSLVVLDRELSTEEKARLQESLTKRYRGTPPRFDGEPWCRLPGFINWKPEHERDGKFPEVVIIKANWEVLSVPTIWSGSPQRKRWSYLGQGRDSTSSALRQRLKEERRAANSTQWRDFATTDLAVSDLRYACHLIRMGLSRQEVVERLRQESPNLAERFGVHADDYLQRTVNKAIIHVNGMLPV
ncbi:MAG: hypothetical protein H5U02_02660 [Clostridia bacterium]|nr:hypothetical protein [Clostridia bacterium]